MSSGSCKPEWGYFDQLRLAPEAAVCAASGLSRVLARASVMVSDDCNLGGVCHVKAEDIRQDWTQDGDFADSAGARVRCYDDVVLDLSP